MLTIISALILELGIRVTIGAFYLIYLTMSTLIEEIFVGIIVVLFVPENMKLHIR